MADDRSYKLGNRRPGYRGGKGTFDPARFAWTINNIGQFVIMVNPVEDDKQAGPSVRLFYPIPGKSFNISWELTTLTEEELVAMKQLIDTAFEWATPIVQQRDKEAAHAFERGDDSQIRIYRQVPQLVFRKRPVEEYGESVLHGSAYAAAMAESDGDQSGGLLGSGDAVAERDEGGSESQDDGTETD